MGGIAVTSDDINDANAWRKCPSRKLALNTFHYIMLLIRFQFLECVSNKKGGKCPSQFANLNLDEQKLIHHKFLSVFFSNMPRDIDIYDEMSLIMSPNLITSVIFNGGKREATTTAAKTVTVQCNDCFELKYFLFSIVILQL